MLSRIASALRGRDPACPEAPTVEDLTVLGYSAGVARAAIAHLLAERAAGRMRCYTYLARSGEWGWHVTIEALRDSALPQDYRRDLGDWAHEWIMGRLPAPGPEGGAA